MDVNIITIVNSIKEILKDEVEVLSVEDALINHKIQYYNEDDKETQINLSFTDLDQREIQIEFYTDISNVIKDIEISSQSDLQISLKLIKFLATLQGNKLVKSLIMELRLEATDEDTWLNFRNNLNKIKDINVLKCNQITE